MPLSKITLLHAVGYAINLFTNHILSIFSTSDIEDVAMKQILVATSDKCKVHRACN
jgi:hypothetical protein